MAVRTSGLQVQHATPQMTAGDVMTAPVLTCGEDDSVAKVSKILERRGITGMPVVSSKASTGGGGSNGEGVLVGIVTVHELRRATANKINPAKPVTSVMVKRDRLSSVTTEMSVREIEELLIADDVGRLPILSADGSGRVEGILTRTDLLRQRAFYKSLHYHNKGFSNSLADRQAWLKLRNKLKQFDIN